MLLTVFLSCSILGAVVGFLAGLLGIGGGLVIVPALVYILTELGVLESHVMPMALATSLASIIITSSSAALTHHKNGNIVWRHAFSISVAVAIGSFGGALIASHLPADVLKLVFAFFVICIASYMIASLKVARDIGEPSRLLLKIIGLITGVIASILGIAGGAILVPSLSYFGIPLRSAMGIATVCGVVVAIFGVLGFLITGSQVEGLPQWSFGYVYLPALLGIIVTSAFTAPLGVKAAANLPVASLKKYFAVFLILVAIKMVWF